MTGSADVGVELGDAPLSLLESISERSKVADHLAEQRRRLTVGEGVGAVAEQLRRGDRSVNVVPAGNPHSLRFPSHTFSRGDDDEQS